MRVVRPAPKKAGILQRLRNRLRRRRGSAGADLGFVLRGFAGFQVLVAARRLGLFEMLHSRPARSLEEIRAELSIPDHSVRALLLASTSLGLIERDERTGSYRNSDAVEQTLVGAAGARIAANLDAFDVLMYRPFQHLTDCLRQGTNVGLQVFPGRGDTLYDRLENHSEAKRVFYDWMAALSAGGPRVPNGVVEALRTSRHVLDVGGGNAGNAIELAKRLPDLKVTIVELPAVCELAAGQISAAGLSGRIALHPSANFHTAPFPAGADGVMFAHIFNIYSDEANQSLVRKSAAALPKGGKLVVYNLVSDDDQKGSWHAGFMSLYFQVLATGTGLVYPPSRYEAWFANAGFDSLTITPAESGDTVFVGIR